MFKMKNKGSFLLMYLAFFIYSLSGIFSKLASTKDFLSFSYILCFVGVIFILGVYALLWQQVLKRIPLSVAMANKPFVLVFGTLWAVLLFGEIIGVKFFIGIAIIIAGLFVMGAENE